MYIIVFLTILCVSAGLAPELQDDDEMRQLHAQHIRDMTLLKYDVEKIRTAAELEHLRSSLADLKAAAAPQQVRCVLRCIIKGTILLFYTHAYVAAG